MFSRFFQTTYVTSCILYLPYNVIDSAETCHKDNINIDGGKSSKTVLQFLSGIASYPTVNRPNRMKGEQGDGTYKLMDDHKGVVNRGMELEHPKLETAEYASVIKGEPQSYSKLKASSDANLLQAEDRNGNQQESTGWSTKKKVTVALLVLLVIILIVVIVVLVLYFTGHLGPQKTTTTMAPYSSPLTTTIITTLGTTTRPVKETDYILIYDSSPEHNYNGSLEHADSCYYQEQADYYQTSAMQDLANTTMNNFTVANVTVVAFYPPPTQMRLNSVHGIDADATGLQVGLDLILEGVNGELPDENDVESTITQTLQTQNPTWTVNNINPLTPTTQSAPTTSSGIGSSPSSGKSGVTTISTTATTKNTSVASTGTTVKPPTSGTTGTTPKTSPPVTTPNKTTGTTSKSTAGTGTTTPHTLGTTASHTVFTGTTLSTTPPITEGSCEANEFQCGDGLCIPLSDKCSADHKNLCANGEDQKFCQYAYSCRPEEFECEIDKTCIPGFYVCDGFRDCPDGADELYCVERCPNRNHFQCDNGYQCINRMQVCNFIKDCEDGSDELSCDYSLPTLECDGGVKLPASMKCNGVFNCIDRTDERFCECNGPNDFQCANGYCIAEDENYCNGFDGCGDNSDEPSGCECQSNQFQCGKFNKTCIPLYKQCNNERDCIDWADEMNCTCNKNQFGCTNGLGPCIDNHLVCNGIPNCPDGSDEQQNCPNCSPYEFQCNGHVCIPYDDYCDGIKQCPDGDDEPSSCPQQPCPDGGFFCQADNRCISSPRVCNGFDDCSDGADEASCPNCAFHCSDGDRCLQPSELCDGIAHCNDRADENCTCGQRINRLHSEYFNDGYPDCRDFSDETDCPGGFHCPGTTSTCISSVKVCDGVQDCSGGDDEAFCVFFQMEDQTNRTVYEWPFRYEGFVQVQHPDGSAYQQFRPDDSVLPLCVDSSLQISLLGKICAAGQGEPNVLREDLVPSSAGPSWLSDSDNFYLANANKVTTLQDFYSGIVRHNAPCPGYFVNITCAQQSCPAPPLQSSNEFGGKSADPYHWPYVVHIIADGINICGGVLITDHHVLTAAHCIQASTMTRLMVQGGWAHVSGSSPTSVQIPVLSTIIHPDYDPITGDSDIAIVHTEDFFNTTRFVRPFCPLKGIPPQQQLPNCFALGWGQKYQDSPESDSLQQTILQPIKQYECSIIPAFENPKNIEITDHMLCAGSPDGSTGTCRGDDGGPLFCPYQNQLLLAGITSWRKGCDIPGVPTVFTFVPNFIDWINDNVYTAGLRLEGTTCEGLFRCFDGRCLPSTKLCDGVANCIQGEDESKQLCSPIEHGEISCLFEFPSICGYERDFSFSQTTQWMFVDYGTAISEYIRHPIHYPNYMLFEGTGEREVQKGRLISQSQGIGDPDLCLFLDYQVFGPNASFAVHLCEASHSLVDINMCALVNKSLPYAGGWQRFTSEPLQQSMSYYTVIDAVFPAGANDENLVAIRNISVSSCLPIVRCNPADQFECANSDTCIPSEFYCDGRVDCPLGEDESQCALEPCFNNSVVNSFYCPSGVNHAVYAGSNRGGYYCIDASTVCDQEPDCNDAEDELDCTCKSNQLKCKNGRCLDHRYWCNQRNDCGDNSDEPFRCNCTSYLDPDQICDGVTDCGNEEDELGCNKCSATQFACIESGYTCISNSQVCDGTKDCKMGEDERTCFDTYVTTDVTVGPLTKEGDVKLKYVEPEVGAVYYYICADSDQTVTAVAQGACANMLYPTVENASAHPTDRSLAKVFIYSPNQAGFLKSFTLQDGLACTASKTVYVVCSNIECGTSQTNPVPDGSNIIGGTVAPLHAWPWSAALLTQPNGPFPGVPYFMCGATVIGKNWVVTAAHCVSYISLADWTINVGAGTNRLSANSAFQQPIANAILLRNATAHEVSDPNNDIALIYLRTPYTFDYSVWPACIPLKSQTFPPVGAQCFTTGFGSDNSVLTDPVLSDDMLQAPTSVLDCTSNPNVNNNYDPDRDVCISGDGYCTGDSGSGVACSNGTYWFLGGTLSRFGEKGTITCGQPNVPDLATRTADYNYWITKVVYCFPDLELWPCNDGSGCIMWSGLCDGKQDCNDNSDELECPSHGLCNDGFRCKNKECARIEGWCDRFYDDCGRFPDSSDELPGCVSKCPPLSLKCDDLHPFTHSRTCVPQNRLCDGVYDCKDHTDELNCGCTSDEFECKDSFCINKNLYCNGYSDCADGSDEPLSCSCVESLPKDRICDGIVDCPYEEDESTCECGLQEFTCNKTIPIKCIPYTQHCNGKSDCPAGEDEVGCFQYIEPNEYLGVTVAGVPMKVCGDQWSTEAATKACNAQFYNKYYGSHVAPVAAGDEFKAYIYNPDNSNEKFPYWFSVTNNCSSNVIIDTQCGVPMCGINKAFPDQYYGPDGRQYTSIASAQAPFPSVGALYFNNAFVCSGVLIASNLFAAPASCFRNYIQSTTDLEYYTVRLGTSRLSAVSDSTQFKVISYYYDTHQYYNPKNFQNDYLIVTLDRRAASNVLSVWPACLTDTVPSSRNMHCYAVGWVPVGNGNRTYEIDQVVDEVAILPNSFCHNDDPSRICVGHLNDEYNEGLMGHHNASGRPCMREYSGAVMCSPRDGEKWYLAGFYQANSSCNDWATSAVSAPYFYSFTNNLFSYGCENNICRNGATCVGDYSDHYCICQKGFSGENCERLNCDETLTKPSGSFHTPAIFQPFKIYPNYPPDADCRWIITVDPTKQVKLSFGLFNLAPADRNGVCTDYVEIYQSWWYSPRQFVGRYCGTTAPPDFTSIANTVIVEFHSGNQIINYDGFAASYQSVDCVTRITNASEGTLMNPGFPHGYLANATCTWYITAPQNSQELKFVINEITFPPGIPPCFLHYVKIYNGTSTDEENVLDTLCSDAADGKTYVVDNFQATVVFHSVGAVDFGGFNISWFADVNNCVGQTCPPLATCVDEVHSFTCLCPNGYEYQPPNCIKIDLCQPNPCRNNAYCLPEGDTYRCLCSADWTGTNCQELQHAFYFTGQTGILETPSFGYNNYPNNYVAFWFITLSDTETINLEFIIFDVEPDIRCSLDNVYVYEGTETNPMAYLLDGPLCNTIPPKASYTSTTNRMTVVFSSDETGTYRGFEAEYVSVRNNPKMFSEAVGCGGAINPVGFGGKLSSQFFPEPYPAGSKCIWTISGDFSRIEIMFRAIHLAHGDRICYDSVDIYDGDLIVPQKSLAKACNESMVGVPIRSYSSIVTIVFTSTEIDVNQNSGFTLDYSQSSALCSNQPCRNGGICSDIQDFIVCTCKEGFTGPFCESTTSCNVTLLDPQGSITSPNYPGDYNSIENCYWTIIAPAGYLIYLRFDAFAIEPSNSINECVDFVRVYNDSETFSRFPDKNSYCGFNTPGPFYSTANIMYIQLLTDETGTWPGFSATYSMVLNYCKHNNTCNDHEMCINLQTGSTCRCLPGWDGLHCEREINFCSSNPCVNGGTCKPEFNGFTCECPSGYISENCSIDTYCGLAFNPCQHGSTCEHGPDGPICHCTSKWAGTHCQTARCNNVYTEPSGVIESPDYPLLYPGGLDCTYTFFAPTGQVIKFYFDDFELLQSVDTICIDYLALYNSQLVNVSTEIAKWCGIKSPGFTIATTSNFATLVFHTRQAAIGAGAGFSIRYFFDEDACQGVGCGSNKYAVCENNFDLGFHCVCMPGYTGYPNCVEIDNCAVNPCKNGGSCVNSVLGFTCVCPSYLTGTVCETEIDYCTPNPCLNHGVCGQVRGEYYCNCREDFTGRNCENVNCPLTSVTAARGNIQSPGYPYEYPPDADCQWVLQTDVGKIFYLTIIDLNIEGPFPTCDYDYLAIYDGGDFTSEPTYKLCGKDTDPPQALNATSSSKVGVLFHTDSNVQATGFNLEYASGYLGYCNGTINANHGFLYSLGYPSQYQPNGYCVYTIVAPWDVRIVLTFDTVDLDPTSTCDDTYIEVFDYKYQVPWRSLGKICSNNQTDKVFQRSLTNAMSVVFKTGPINDGHTGFKAHFVPEIITGCIGDTCPDNGYCAFTPGGPRCMCYEGFEMVGDFCIPQFCNRIDCPTGTTCQNSFEYGAYCAPCGEGYSGRYCNFDDWCGLKNPCNTKGGTCVHGDSGPVCQCKTGYTGQFCENQLPAYRCGGEYVDFPGIMNSPSPGNLFYPPNADCTWILRSNEHGSVVSIYFDMFLLQNSTDCSADNVKIYDTNGDLLATFCGNHRKDDPLPIVSSHGIQMTVVFHTNDDDLQDFGFSARYFLSPNYCTGATCPANSHCENNKVNYTCECNPGYTGSDCSQKINYCNGVTCQNKGTCVSDQTGYHCVCMAGYTGQQCETYMDPCEPNQCQHGGLCVPAFEKFNCSCINGYYGPLCENPPCVYYLNEPSGIIQSPAYPELYANDIICTWHITAGHRQIIDFRFLKIDIEGPEFRCYYDSVRIFDGPSLDSSTLLTTACGRIDNVLGPFMSSDFDMTVLFTSDSTVQGAGFTAVYNFTHLACKNYPCPAHAACITGPEGNPYCQCDYHYQGQNCDRIDDCQFVNCAHGGTCTEDEAGNFMCTCRPGFTGPFCEIIIDNCISFPCQHGGTCLPSEGNYTCECTYDWGGNNCESSRTYTVINDLQTGLVNSPNFPGSYPANAHYLWIIQAFNPYVAIKLHFLNFAVEGFQNQNCQDYVVLYDGDLRQKQGAILLAKLCGIDLPHDFVSRQNAISITFDSDKSIQMQGFSIQYTLLCPAGLTGVNCSDLDMPTYSICDQRSIYMPNGYLTSPGYPGQFPDSLNCPVTIDVQPYMHVPVQFIDFDVDDDTPTCDTNSVSLYDGHDTHANLTGKYCNGNPPPTGYIDSSSDAVTIVFLSGTPQSGASTGFNITWAALEDVCVHSDCGFGDCIANGDSFTCNCDVGWSGDNCNVQTFLSYNICDKTGAQRIDNGYLITPNYPQNYSPNDDCTIILETRPGFVYSYKFTDFQLQEPDGGVVCNDHVSLYDSRGEVPSQLIGSFCGSIMPVLQPGFTSSNYLTIEFKTDSFAQARGFNLTFATIVDYCRGRYCPTNAYCVNLEQDQGYDCVCKAGWKDPPNCDTDIDECLQSPCLNNGLCINTPGSFKCKCLAGWMGTYCEIDNFCQQNTCFNGGTCSHGEDGPVCTCPTGFTGQYCENVDCGGTLTDPTGEIDSPFYPNKYPPFANCAWYITVAEGSFVNLHFNDFQLEASTGCTNDYLEIWFDNEINEVPDKVLCGIGIEPDVKSNINFMTLQFKSDKSIEFKGFNLTYTTVPPAPQKQNP